MAEAPKALLFDVFGTVVDWRGSMIRELEAFGSERGITADWGAVADRWRSLYQPAMEEIRSNRRDWVRLDVLHGENLDRLWQAFALPRLNDSDRHRLVTGWHRLDPWPDAVAGLARLKSRFIIAPVSNGNIALIVNMAKRAGLPWDVVLGAEVAQAYKPSRDAYLRSAAALCLEPSDCMMVAAHNDDLKAAQGFGLKTAFVPRPLEHGPHGSETEATGDWDHVAADFEVLADQLGC